MANLDFHIVKRLRDQIAQGGNRTALKHKVGNVWQGISWQQFGEQIDTLSLALLAQGLRVQDKIGIYSNNMPQWTVADFAALQARLVTVPIYPTNTAAQSSYIIQNADVKILFVGEQAQFDAAVSLFEECEQLEVVVAMSDDIDLQGHSFAVSWNDFMTRGVESQQAEFDARLADANMDDLLTLIYTSGTTGQPKGVMLDYTNVGYQLEGHDERLSLTKDDVSLCFLPLSHVFERAWTFYVLYKGATNCYLQDTMQVRDALSDVKPTVKIGRASCRERVYAPV